LSKHSTPLVPRCDHTREPIIVQTSIVQQYSQQITSRLAYMTYLL